MGALVTLEVPDETALNLPWIITFGPLDDSEEWEPVVCGPYERDHALALASTVVADEDLMAVVEPLLPHASVDDITRDIEESRANAEVDDEFEFEDEEGDDVEVALDESFDEAEASDESDEDEEDDEELVEEDEFEEVEPTTPPSPRRSGPGSRGSARNSPPARRSELRAVVAGFGECRTCHDRSAL